MGLTRLDVRPAIDRRPPPDDFADEALIEMANADERDTNIPGTAFLDGLVPVPK